MRTTPIEHWLVKLHTRHRMMRVLGIAVLLLAAAWLSHRTLTGSPQRVIGRVTAVNDDLSLTVRPDDGGGARRITLAGLQWPDAWRDAAGEQLRQLALNQPIVAVRSGYAPPAMVVYLNDGALLNETLCDGGYACHDASDAGLLAPWLGRVQRWASWHKRGLWAAEADEQTKR